MDEREFFAEFFVKARAASAAEHHRRDIERGDVGVRGGRDVPGEVQAREFGGELDMCVAPPELRGLRWDENGRQRLTRMFGKNLREL